MFGIHKRKLPFTKRLDITKVISNKLIIYALSMIVVVKFCFIGEYRIQTHLSSDFFPQ